ncbi:MAG TPA: S8/S53 family peptidase [Ktedonobacteraceae bacterium]|jgi:hypothetical protein|nr:S8/S53 family peptidase [Ktedonobacteraceae bacterium]
MNMQGMPMDRQGMHNPHDTFWRNDGVTIIFRSVVSLTSGDPILNKKRLLDKLGLYRQLGELNTFLQEQAQVPVTLHFLDDSDHPEDGEQDDRDQHSKLSPQDAMHEEETIRLPAGVYLFSTTAPIRSDFGEINTGITCFLKFGEGEDPSHTLVPTVVNAFNKSGEGEGLDYLNKVRGVPLVFSAPIWLSGATGGIPQGCPLTPPIPVRESCSNWHLELPNLNKQLEDKTGKGVTTFILDAFPEHGVIARAARDAGDDNLLLRRVFKHAQFDYTLLSGVQEDVEEPALQFASVGKDVYGRHYPIRIPDHGLFIAGIIHDLAPDAPIECIRVLDEMCVGDLNILSAALSKIYNRMLSTNPDTGQVGDLYQKSVVINLSLVIPTDDEIQSTKKIDSLLAGGFNIVHDGLYYVVKSLIDQGAIIVASAGNEGDQRDPMGPYRPAALYPAAFGSGHDGIDGVIPVGAIDKDGNVTSYSCYSGLRGIATWGGEVPKVSPPNPPSTHPIITTTPLDAVRGIYSSVEYPPLSSDPPAEYYDAPDDSAWAYWIGTSFATPIITALAARVLELKPTTSVHQYLLGSATTPIIWSNMDPGLPGVVTQPGAMSGSIDGRAYKVVQTCVAGDHDDEDEVQVEIEVTEIDVVVNK